MSGTQTWKADRYVKHAGFVADLGMPVVELLAPQSHERILDLGCGDGALTAKLADMAGAVVGVDAGEDMIAAARARGLDAHVMNGHDLTFDAEFDAVFSNAALHWMLDPDTVIAGVRRALKPAGRFVGEFGGHGNVAAICVALIAARRRETGAVVLPDAGGIPGKAGGRRIHGAHDRADSQADAAADRHRRLAGHLRGELLPRRAGRRGGKREAGCD